MISCSVATWRAKAPRPVAVAVTVVCGFLPTKALSTATWPAFANVSIWAPRLPSVAPVSFFSFENSNPMPAGSAFSAAMIRSRNGWWMMSSSSAIALAPAHPQAAEHQPATIDKGHPQVEPVADPKIAHQRERAGGKTDGDKGMPDPEPG